MISTHVDGFSSLDIALYGSYDDDAADDGIDNCIDDDDVDVSVRDDEVEVSDLAGSPRRWCRLMLVTVAALPIWLGIDALQSMLAVFHLTDSELLSSVTLADGRAHFVTLIG